MLKAAQAVLCQHAGMSGTEAQPEQRLSALTHIASTATFGEYSDFTACSMRHRHFRCLSDCPGFTVMRQQNMTFYSAACVSLQVCDVDEGSV